jgi:hypothetical protein
MPWMMSCPSAAGIGVPCLFRKTSIAENLDSGFVPVANLPFRCSYLSWSGPSMFLTLLATVSFAKGQATGIYYKIFLDYGKVALRTTTARVNESYSLKLPKLGRERSQTCEKCFF